MHRLSAALLSRITNIAGQPCMTEEARLPLRRLALRTLGETRQDDLVVLPGGVEETAHLPGGIILLNRALIEDYEDPDVTAGYVLADITRPKDAERPALERPCHLYEFLLGPPSC